MTQKRGKIGGAFNVEPSQLGRSYDKYGTDLNKQLVKLLKSSKNTCGNNKLVVIMAGHGTKYKSWLKAMNTDPDIIKGITTLNNGAVAKLKFHLRGASSNEWENL